MVKKLTFVGGVHPNDNKAQTASKPIVAFPARLHIVSRLTVF